MISAKLRPDFTGEWEMNFEKSILRFSPPKRILMKIEHREPRLIQEIVVTNTGGTEQRTTFTYETGAETINSIGPSTARTRTRWEGMELVIESRMQTSSREVYFQDHWSLSHDGRTLTMAHRDDDLAGQISVLEKSAQADTINV
jgi:hypothetical protein